MTSIQNRLPPQWTEADNGVALIEELQKEMGEAHLLFGKSITVIAKRKDVDDVLYEVSSEEGMSYAVVHLTWKGSKESDPKWPTAKLYRSLDEFLNEEKA